MSRFGSRRIPALMRRPSGVSAGSSGISAQVVEGLDATNEYSIAAASADTPVPGTDPMTWFLVLLSRGAESGTNGIVFGQAAGVNASNGWAFANAGSLGYLRFNIGSSTGPTRYSIDLGAMIADESGELIVYHVTMDTSRVMRAYRNGIRLDLETAFVGGYQSSTSDLHFGGVNTINSGIVSAGYSFDTLLDDAGVEAHYQALLSDHAADFTGIDRHWVGDDATASAWVDRVGSLSLAAGGTPTLTAATGLTYRQRYDPASWSTDTTAHPDGAIVDPVILFDGDSITVGVGATTPSTEGYVPVVESSLAVDSETDLQGSSVVNNGASGSKVEEHEDGAAEDVTIPMANNSPDIVSVMLGTNNTTTDASLADAKAAYPRLIADIFAQDSGVRLIVSSVPNHAFGANITRAIEWNRWLLYEEWPRIESAYGITLHRVNASALPGEGPGPSQVDGEFFDNVHPNTAGHAVLATQVLAAVRASAGYSP